MATTTTNYGWTVPTSSDLVKNGATAISTVGSSVDTALWNSGFGQAGKNKIINGDFYWWQRGTTFNSGFPSYTADRWVLEYSSATGLAVTQQAFTAGAAPVAGYEGVYFLRYAVSSAAVTHGIGQRVENVQTFAGQTVTLSFWAKAVANTTITSSIRQNFGSGGSTEVITSGASHSVTTSWQRFNVTIAVPSISGKTIGSGSYLQVRLLNTTNATFTMDIWGVQVEAGSTATPFQTATGTIQGELAACQRYFRSSYSQGVTIPTNSTSAGIVTFSATSVLGNGTFGRVQFSTIMRVAPTITTYSYVNSSTGVMSDFSTGANLSASSAAAYGVGTDGFNIYNASGGTAAGIYGFMCHYKADAEL